jgi:hypothetical protein
MPENRFSWDARKNRTNIEKHGISFPKAAKIFDAARVEKEDVRRDYGEKRTVALGRSEGRILRVVYTRRNSVIRIISARKAKRDERAEYIRRVHPITTGHNT